ncbi:MAG: cysteine desulfurase NifS [Chloroflexi bacterium]|nr:cysteine desulfurase NifS [Chloroflexota bacterium]MBT7082029.1 cysteine desulfurase NifS [Chloroflexota bacterium]MBT7289700.1 cysteine desulfurase NifS [Chloroflexota bacterium]
MKRIYLDHAATTPAREEVVQAMLPFFTDSFGNPSSIYSYGVEAREAMVEAREKVANLINASADEIVFTSGGTEADNHAIQGIAYGNLNKGNHIITSTIEHHAVLDTCQWLEKRGFNVTYLPVDKHGIVDPNDVKKAITDKTTLITIMHANNEMGTIEPIAEISKIARDAGVYMHTDAVQTAGHIPTDVGQMGVDLLSISAHKLYGPKGIGALYVKKGTDIAKFLHGGAQEQNRRGTTENIAGIVGFGVAAEMAKHELTAEMQKQNALRDRLIAGISEHIEDTHLMGHPLRRLPNNVNMRIDYVEGESILLNLDIEGICASSGSACTSASLDPSHVMLALNVPHDQARSTIRFTLGRMTSEQEIDHVLERLPVIVKRLRSMSPLIKRS